MAAAPEAGKRRSPAVPPLAQRWQVLALLSLAVRHGVRLCLLPCLRLENHIGLLRRPTSEVRTKQVV